MLYNTSEQRVKKDLDCASCPYFDKPTKTCNGIGVCCYEYDQVTATCIDPITKLPFNPNEVEQ